MTKSIQQGLIRRQVQNVTGPGMDFEEFEADVIRSVSLASGVPVAELGLPIPSSFESSLSQLYDRFKKDAGF